MTLAASRLSRRNKGTTAKEDEDEDEDEGEGEGENHQKAVCVALSIGWETRRDATDACSACHIGMQWTSR